jgi:hypothetical protein
MKSMAGSLVFLRFGWKVNSPSTSQLMIGLFTLKGLPLCSPVKLALDRVPLNVPFVTRKAFRQSVSLAGSKVASGPQVKPGVGFCGLRSNFLILMTHCAFQLCPKSLVWSVEAAVSELREARTKVPCPSSFKLTSFIKNCPGYFI